MGRSGQSATSVLPEPIKQRSHLGQDENENQFGWRLLKPILIRIQEEEVGRGESVAGVGCNSTATLLLKQCGTPVS